MAITNVEHSRTFPTGRVSLLIAGALVAAFGLFKRARRQRLRRTDVGSVSSEWLAQHVSHHGDSYGL